MSSFRTPIQDSSSSPAINQPIQSPIEESISTPTPNEEPHQTPQVDSRSENQEQEEQEQEEEGECGFCLFMKGGGCKDSFVAWEKCIEDAEKNQQDIVENCFEITAALKKCMEAHSEYYDPVLQAEKAAEAQAVEQLEKEKEKEKEGGVVEGEKAKEEENA